MDGMTKKKVILNFLTNFSFDLFTSQIGCGIIESFLRGGRNITTHKISSLRVAIRFDYGFVAQLVEHRTFLWKLCQEIDT